MVDQKTIHVAPLEHGAPPAGPPLGEHGGLWPCSTKGCSEPSTTVTAKPGSNPATPLPDISRFPGSPVRPFPRRHRRPLRRPSLHGRRRGPSPRGRARPLRQFRQVMAQWWGRAGRQAGHLRRRRRCHQPDRQPVHRGAGQRPLRHAAGITVDRVLVAAGRDHARLPLTSASPAFCRCAGRSRSRRKAPRFRPASCRTRGRCSPRFRGGPR